MSEFIDLTGRKFGRLTVVSLVSKDRMVDGKRVPTLWRCLCSCGNYKVVRRNDLTVGATVSCGCWRRERSSRDAGKMRAPLLKHGHAHRGKHSAEYTAFYGARDRCTNEDAKKWKYYGGRGIKFMFKSFEQFLLELGSRPSKRTLDRINNDGNYKPGNVRWATWRQQRLNQRPRMSRKAVSK